MVYDGGFLGLVCCVVVVCEDCLVGDLLVFGY